MGGTQKRMQQFANYISQEMDVKLPVGTTLRDISQDSNRYSMYKVGPVLSISVSILYLKKMLWFKYFTAIFSKLCVVRFEQVSHENGSKQSSLCIF